MGGVQGLRTTFLIAKKMNSYLLPKKCYTISRSYSFFIIAVLVFFAAAAANAYDSDYSNEVCVAGGIACAADTGSAKDSGNEMDYGGGGKCLISAAADGSRLAAEMPADLLILGFFFLGFITFFPPGHRPYRPGAGK